MLNWLFGVVFGAGVAVMYLTQALPEKVCPVVEGQKVVSSYHVNDGHYCVYVAHGGTGRTKRVIKL